MTKTLGQVAYEALREHESFDFGTWDDLMPGQRAYVGAAAEAVVKAHEGVMVHDRPDVELVPEYHAVIEAARSGDMQAIAEAVKRLDEEVEGD